MEINNKDYRRYKKMALVVCNYDSMVADDVLNNTIEKIIARQNNKKGKANITDEYIFISLKNNYLNYLEKEKRYRVEYTESYYVSDDFKSDEELDNTFFLSEEKVGENTLSKNNINKQGFYSDERIDDIQYIDDIAQSRLDHISKIAEGLETFDKQLFYLHYVKGMSQRKIARETGIGLITIHKKINKIKDFIVSTYDSKENK